MNSTDINKQVQKVLKQTKIIMFRYIQMMYLVKQPHSGWCGRNDVVYKEEEGIFGPQVDPFPNEEVELPHFRNKEKKKVNTYPSYF